MIYLKTTEAARALGITAQTLKLWDRTGKLKPEYRLPSGHRRYTERQVSEFLASRR